jgi:outer membrane receptor protein involved in Fe transport
VALGASYRHASGLGGALVARGIGSYPLDDTRLRTIEARLTVDGRIEYRYGGATLSVEVFNLFDAAGVTSGTVDPSGSGVALYDPAPGRSVFATVRIEL